MSRWIYLAVGLFSYVSFLAVFAAAAAFVGGFLLPRTIDGPPGMGTPLAVLVNLGLVIGFGLQHSIMARPGFKAVWTRIIPQPIERSVYVLVSNVMMVVLFLLWQPIGPMVWDIEAPILRGLAWAVFAAGWLAVPLSSLAIDHLELFGVKQVWRYFKGTEHAPPRFHTPGPYRWVRHPLYTSWAVAFWATPTMSLGHLLFAFSLSAYMLVAIRLEEKDLLQEHGDDYAEWREATPMIVPGVPRMN